MAYEEPLIGWQEEDSEEDENGRVDSIGGTVIADSRDEAYQALTAIGIVVGDEFDGMPGKVCVRRNVSRPDGPSNMRRWRAQFRGVGSSGDSTAPENLDATVAFQEGAVTEPSYRDADGLAYLSTSGELPDPFTDETATFFFVIDKWEREYDARKRILFSKTCNSDPCRFLSYEFKPGELALRSYLPRGDIRYKSTGVQVPDRVLVSYRFEARGTRRNPDGSPINDGDGANAMRTGFYERVPDLGSRAWVDNGGTIRLAPIQIKDIETGLFRDAGRVPLINGTPADITANGYYVGGLPPASWHEKPPSDEFLYITSGGINGGYFLAPLLKPVAYANILDESFTPPFLVS